MFHMFVNSLNKYYRYQHGLLSSLFSMRLLSGRMRSSNSNKNAVWNEICVEKKCRLEVEVDEWHSRNQSCPHPNTLSTEDWMLLSHIESKTQRRKYCRELYAKATRKNLRHHNKMQKQEEIRIKRDKMFAERSTNDHIIYGLGHSSIFLRYDKKHFNGWRNLKLARSKEYGVKVLVDCSFESSMTALEQYKVANGVRKTFLMNRTSAQPLDLQMCGVQPNSDIMDMFRQSVPNLGISLLATHNQCYSEVYPKHRLVVLTPDSSNTLAFNANDIYVVSGLVDFARSDPVTLDKADRLGIRTAKLPLHLMKLAPGKSIEMPFFNVVNCIRARCMNENWLNILEELTPLEIQYQYQHLSDEDRKQIIAKKCENEFSRPEITIDDYER